MNDIKAMKELFGLSASTGKFDSDWTNILYDGQLGIINTVGEIWSEQRQFFIKTLKQFGLGRGTTLEPTILEESDQLCDWIANELEISTGRPVQISKLIMQAVGNVLGSIVKGERVTSKDIRLITLLDEVIHLINVTTKSGMAFIPFIKYIAPELSGYAKFKWNTQQMWDMVEEYVNEHKRRKMTRNLHEEPSDIIDAYIDRVESCTDPNSSFYGEIGWKNAVSSIKTILIAGTETTVSTLHWLILYLAVNEEVQQKLHEEVETIIGNDRQPTLLNKSRFL